MAKKRSCRSSNQMQGNGTGHLLLFVLYSGHLSRMSPGWFCCGSAITVPAKITFASVPCAALSIFGQRYPRHMHCELAIWALRELHTVKISLTDHGYVVRDGEWQVPLANARQLHLNFFVPFVSSVPSLFFILSGEFALSRGTDSIPLWSPRFSAYAERFVLHSFSILLIKARIAKWTTRSTS